MESLLPRPLIAVVELFGDCVAELDRETKGCTGRSWPGEGPVDRMKSAKSRIESDWMRGSLASGLGPTDFLVEVGRPPGPLFREPVRAGIGCEPN